MKKYLHLIRNSPLFSGMTDDEILSILDCMNGTVKRYQKDAVILRSGDIVHNVGIVLSGNVHIVKEDFWENDNILTCLGNGQIFAEAYACLGTERLEINVIAKERTDVLFINVNKIMNVCTSACEFHSVLIRNLLWSLAEKNLVVCDIFRLIECAAPVPDSAVNILAPAIMRRHLSRNILIVVIPQIRSEHHAELPDIA